MKQSACSSLNISHLPNPRIRIEEKPEEDEKKNIVDVLKKETRSFTYEKFLLAITCTIYKIFLTFSFFKNNL
jgi:hypothetical protein